MTTFLASEELQRPRPLLRAVAANQLEVFLAHRKPPRRRLEAIA
jgi:hypothetical protein